MPLLLTVNIGRYVKYCDRSEAGLLLDMDSPESRPVQTPEQGSVVALPQWAAIIDTNVALHEPLPAP